MQKFIAINSFGKLEFVVLARAGVGEISQNLIQDDVDAEGS